MKAAVYHRFGSPDVLELQDIAQPALSGDGVLVRVRASSVNPAEWFAVTGRPYLARAAMGLRRPTQPVPGAEVTGVCSTHNVEGQDATLVLVGGPKTNPWTGPLGHIAGVRLASPRASQKVGFFVARFTRADFRVLQELLEAGKVTPVIDRQYQLTEVPASTTSAAATHGPRWSSRSEPPDPVPSPAGARFS